MKYTEKDIHVGMLLRWHKGRENIEETVYEYIGLDRLYNKFYKECYESYPPIALAKLLNDGTCIIYKNEVIYELY